RRYGLELTFVHVRSGPIGMAALAAGESQLHEGSVTGAVLGSAAEGTDLVFVAGIINKLIGNIMASPKIKSPADLKGKVIGVTSGPGTDAAVLNSFAKGLHQPKVEQAVERYVSLPLLYTRRTYPTVDGVRNVIRLLGTTNEKIRRQKAEELIDDRFVKKLEN